MPHNVLHILGTAQPEGISIARVPAALARGLDPERYRIHAWFLVGDGPLVGMLEAAGAQARALRWWQGVRDPAGAWRFWRSLRPERFAIIHMHFGGRSVRWLARLGTRAKIIAHLHGRILEPRGLTQVWFSYPGVDTVVAVSHAVAERVVGAHPRVVYAGVPLPEEGSVPVRRAGGTTERVIGTAGRLVPLKGMLYLLRALAALHAEFPDLVLEIAGSGAERSTLEREVRLLGVEGKVRFLGWVEDLAPALARWDVFVLPSLEEGAPVAALEAMAAGLPVVATAVGGIPEFVEEGRTGYLVRPQDPGALADRLRVLLLDPAQKRAMGAAGRARVRTHFSESKMVSGIAAVYERLLSGC